MFLYLSTLHCVCNIDKLYHESIAIIFIQRSNFNLVKLVGVVQRLENFGDSRIDTDQIHQTITTNVHKRIFKCVRFILLEYFVIT